MRAYTTQNGTPKSHRRYVESYRVIGCPLYLEDRRDPERQKWDGPYWDAPVCMECYSREICMEVKGTCNRRARCAERRTD